MTGYERLRGVVLAALVREDPMGLSAPDNDLADEYDAEAREIARRLVHAGRRAGVTAVIDEVFEASFETTLPRAVTHRIAAALESAESPG